MTTNTKTTTHHLEVSHNLLFAVGSAGTAWLEQFYNDDPRRKVAGDLFKIESGDDGSQHDLSSVLVGAGESYLNEIP